MIMIDSKAGQRFARACHAYEQAEEACAKEPFSVQRDLDIERAEQALLVEAVQLGKQLMEDGHHLAEDY
ncbi:hypothetical protein R3F64_01360 [Halomonas sp. 5021]|uniref:hypothetical protein n=1 Tax=Halomonas sp. 5021 TaxID=3082156 RepID=UPI002FCA8A28